MALNELCISQLIPAVPIPPLRATPRELAISGKKMAIMSPPQGKKNCAKAPLLYPHPRQYIDCLVHVDLHVINAKYKIEVLQQE